MSRTRLLASLAFTTLALAGCDRFDTRQPAPTGSLTRHLMMVDADGKNYGQVEFDPINGGKVIDAQGRILGRIVPVDAPVVVPATAAPTVVVPGQ